MAVAVAPIVSLLLLASLLLLPAAAHAVDVAGVANSNNAPPVHKCIHDTEAFRHHVADAKRKSGVTVALQSYETLNAYRELARETAKGPRNETTLAPPPPTSDVGPIRIAWSTLDLDDPTHYCTAVGQTVPNFMGGTATCTDVTILTPAKRDILLKKVLPAAVARLAKAISVHRVLDNLMVPSQSVCSEPWSVPVNHTVEGVPNSDYVLYVAAAPTTGGTIAFAAYCAHDENGRPVIGRMNFSPEFLQWNDVDPSQNGLVLNTAAHELTHALGFTYDFFQSGFKDKRSAVLGTTVRGGQPANIVNTPTVVEAARSFFGCATAQGVELEDQGGSGTINSHWDRRNVMQELMVGAGGSRLSSITLSLLQDTGYYFVDFSKAEPMTWGANASCAFIDEKCDSTSPLYPQYWCNDTNPSDRHCTLDNRAVGYCAVGTYGAPLPSYWQYFSNPNVGGVIELMDYCPIIYGFANLQCDNTSQPLTAATTAYGFTFGTGSRCIQTDPTFSKVGVAGNAGSRRCFTARCPEGARVQISVQGSPFVDCPADGSAAVISAPPGYVGAIHCPTAKSFCDESISVYAATTTSAQHTGTTALVTTGAPENTTQAPLQPPTPPATAAPMSPTPRPTYTLPPETPPPNIEFAGNVDLRVIPNAAVFQSYMGGKLGVPAAAIIVDIFNTTTGGFNFHLAQAYYGTAQRLYRDIQLGTAAAATGIGNIGASMTGSAPIGGPTPAPAPSLLANKAGLAAGVGIGVLTVIVVLGVIKYRSVHKRNKRAAEARRMGGVPPPGNNVQYVMMPGAAGPKTPRGLPMEREQFFFGDQEMNHRGYSRV